MISQALILLTISCSWISYCSLYNPGLLLQIPNSYNLPSLPIQFPQSIPSMLIQNLQLTNIELRNIQYEWKLQKSNFIVNIPTTLISFDWTYGKDSGKGTFVQTYELLNITTHFTMNSKSRFQIAIDKAVISTDEGKSKISIHLGGGVKETIIVQITNIITNNAKFAFREAVSKAIKSLIQNFSEPLQNDIKIVCPKSKCIYLNTTLLTNPLVSENKTIIQINGAPYLEGTHSGILNASSILFKTSSAKISIQLHQQVIQKIVQLYGNQVQFIYDIKSTQISSIADITSQTLSIVFPEMQYFANPKDVIFHLQVTKLSFYTSMNKSLNFEAQLQGNIKTQTISKQFNFLPDPYINKATGNILGKVEIVSNLNKIGFKLLKLLPQGIDWNPEDIDAKRVEPSSLDKYIETLTSWGAGAFNGQNKYKFLLEFLSWKCNINSNILEESIEFELDIYT